MNEELGDEIVKLCADHRFSEIMGALATVVSFFLSDDRLTSEQRAEITTHFLSVMRWAETQPRLPISERLH